MFLLGDDLDGWWKGRADFITLTGPTPLLPDFAYVEALSSLLTYHVQCSYTISYILVRYGVWYTWYVIYTEQRAKDEIGNWTAGNFPLDVWGLVRSIPPFQFARILCLIVSHDVRI